MYYNVNEVKEMGIGRRIKEARELLGLTQKELGDRVGVTGSAITNYECETSHPKEPIMYKLINELHIDANFLFQDSVDTQKTAKSETAGFSITELDIIKKYRSLDQRGQRAVLETLDREFSYVPHNECNNPLSNAHIPDMDDVKKKAEAYAELVRKKQTVPTEK